MVDKLFYMSIALSSTKKVTEHDMDRLFTDLELQANACGNPIQYIKSNPAGNIDWKVSGVYVMTGKEDGYYNEVTHKPSNLK
eukprot:7089012-Heterocapsa_arctica.AAC.1